jgi:hypothetical protein
MFAATVGMHKSVVLAGLLVLEMAMSVSAHTLEPRQSRTNSSGKGDAAAQLDRYQVPAGAALLLKLRTPLSSATASIDDQVEATLWSPIIQNNVELIPVGSVAIGKVVGVVRASERTPIGAVTFAFTIVEHADTGSRAMMNTQKVVIEAPREPQARRGRGKDKLKVTDATIPSGTPVVAMTSEPLIVRIPR